jgi:hypothetical protein
MEKPTIVLTEADHLLARQIATLRKTVNLAEGTGGHNYNYHKKDPWEIELLGVLGEMAFCKYHNLYFDLTFNSRSGGHDCVAKDGKSTVDIKTTDVETHCLIVKKNKNQEGKRCDYYALVTGVFPKFTLHGYATADMVFSNWLDHLPTPAYGLQQSDLKQFTFGHRKYS